MKKLFLLSILLLTVLFYYSTFAQNLGSLRKDLVISFPEKVQYTSGTPLEAGTYSIGVGGHFPSIDSVFNKLSMDGIAGEVILEFIDNLYTAPTNNYGFFLNGPIPGAGPNSRVTIKPAANKNVIIEGSGVAAVTLLNTSYVTIDGVSLSGATTLTIHSIANDAFQVNDGIDFLDNSDNNIMQNIIFNNERYTTYSGSGFYTNNTDAAPDNNIIQDNFVKESGMGLYVAGSTSTKAKDNIIRRNKIGSETDNLIAWGIQATYSQNTIIENNIIQNLKITMVSFDQLTVGINSYYGIGNIIRNNIVYNIRANAGYTCTGILLSGGFSEIGSANQIYNNMIFDIQSISTSSDSRVAGIQTWAQNNPMIYYNTVFLSGTGANQKGSAALYLYTGSNNVDAKNNIFINTRNESPYCASAISVTGSVFAISNYNDLYSSPGQYNCVVNVAGSINYFTLNDWQATGKDLQSITEMPNFIEPNLHINSTIPTNIESHAIPLPSILTDLEGDLRHATTPDIGADEFNGILLAAGDETDVPKKFALEQNYPNPFNPSTSIKYSITSRQLVTLKVYNVLGIELQTVLNEEKQAGNYEVSLNASNMPSGVYFYRLQAGTFDETKKMILIK